MSSSFRFPYQPMEEPLEVIETTIMATSDDFHVIILICDGSFLSINLELSGSVARLYCRVEA